MGRLAFITASIRAGQPNGGQLRGVNRFLNAPVFSVAAVSPALADEIYVCESQSPVSYNALNLRRPSVASHPGPLASDRSVPAGGAATATLSLTAATPLRGNGTAAGGGGGAAGGQGTEPNQLS
jgi:hypothetical protein